MKVTYNERTRVLRINSKTLYFVPKESADYLQQLKNIRPERAKFFAGKLKTIYGEIK